MKNQYLIALKAGLLTAFLSCGLFTGSLNAQTRMFYISGYNSATATFPITASGMDAIVNSVSHSYSGLTTYNDGRCVWWNTNASATLDPATAPYLQFTVNLKNPMSLTFDRFVMCGLATFNSSVRLQLRWSLDSYASSLGEFTINGSSYTLSSVNLTSQGVKNVSSFEFRVFFYGANTQIFNSSTGPYPSLDGTPSSYGNFGQNMALWFTNPGPVLPLSWKSFTATRRGSSSILSWITDNERQTDGFMVQHSTDASNWTNLGELPSAGTPGEHTYNFTHSTPAPGMNYYRLEQRDLDGRSTYSSVVQVQFAPKVQSFIVRGNPVLDGLIRIECLQPQRIRLISSTGIVVAERDLTQGLQTLPVNGLAPGMYILSAGEQREQVIIK